MIFKHNNKYYHHTEMEEIEGIEDNNGNIKRRFVVKGTELPAFMEYDVPDISAECLPGMRYDTIFYRLIEHIECLEAKIIYLEQKGIL